MTIKSKINNIFNKPNADAFEDETDDYCIGMCVEFYPPFIIVCDGISNRFFLIEDFEDKIEMFQNGRKDEIDAAVEELCHMINETDGAELMTC